MMEDGSTILILISDDDAHDRNHRLVVGFQNVPAFSASRFTLATITARCVAR